MDKIFIKGLLVETTIGVFEWEKHVSQHLCLDLELGTDIAVAASSDQLRDTIDYKAVAKRAQAFMREEQCDLVETLAHRLAAILMEEFSITYMRLTLSKRGAVRGSDAVGIVIERGECG